MLLFILGFAMGAVATVLGIAIWASYTDWRDARETDWRDTQETDWRDRQYTDWRNRQELR